jgi:hypothetical protein
VRRFDCSFIFTYPVQTLGGENLMLLVAKPAYTVSASGTAR